MKKNILIFILIIIILFLVWKILNPTVVTSRKSIDDSVQTETTEISDDKSAQEQSDESDSDVALIPEFRQDVYRFGSVPADKMANTVNDNGHVNKSRQKQQVSDNYVDRTQNNTSNINPEIAAGYNKIYSPQPRVIENPQINTNKNNEHITNPFANSIKMCKPYSEKMNSEYLGMRMDYSIEILGWVNNKCVLNFTADMNGTGSTFSSMYGVSPKDAQIIGFAPKIKCEFTKNQLLYVGDSILQEKERDQGSQNNMLKNPNNVSFSNMGISDAKLLDVIFNDRACEIINSEDYNKMLDSLMKLF